MIAACAGPRSALPSVRSVATRARALAPEQLSAESTGGGERSRPSTSAGTRLKTPTTARLPLAWRAGDTRCDDPWGLGPTYLPRDRSCLGGGRCARMHGLARVRERDRPLQPRHAEHSRLRDARRWLLRRPIQPLVHDRPAERCERQRRELGHDPRQPRPRPAERDAEARCERGSLRARADLHVGVGLEAAPTGKYDVQTTRVAGIGPLKVESNNNIGFGFWTAQTQLGGAWYPFAHKGTAVVAALTHEVNGKKQDFDLTPGQNLTFTWGISQYVPLDEGKTLLLEVGPAGYDIWQVSHDTGSDAATPNVLDQVHAAGGQIGFTYVPWSVVVNFHAFQEFAATDRFQ